MTTAARVTSVPAGGALARALAKARPRIAERLADQLSGWDKFATGLRADRPGFIARELHAFVDYLALLAGTGDGTYRDLYLGEKLKQLYDPGATADEYAARRDRILAGDRDAFLAGLEEERAPDAARVLLAGELDGIAETLRAEAPVSARVLLVGDCLFLDIVSFLTGALLRHGIALAPVFLTSKSPLELRRSIQQSAPGRFDAVFYSPFTYEFSPEFARTQRLRAALSGKRAIERIANEAVPEVRRTLDLLSGGFDCPIFVHRPANIRRHDGTWRERVKNRITRRARSWARQMVNDFIGEYCRAKTSAGLSRLFEIDETRLSGTRSEDELGRFFYHSELQHPAVLGQALAPRYAELLVAELRLRKRKLIVCDLDNTLWDGVIGEGPVTHFHARQQTLKKLRERGVLLAICSKNDPRNVHWEGGTLQAADFVAAEVNWEAKASNIGRLAKKLNLKTKDFVFLDDRADERGMAAMAHPEMVALDATEEDVWRLLETWAELLVSDAGTDRTAFYREREEREQFLNAPVEAAGGPEAEADARELLRKLGLRVHLRPAKARDVARAAELVNRTNQFNLCGSRISARELADLIARETHLVLLVDAADRFGDMGTVAVAILERCASHVEVPVFVLSCRVFGYGIETAILAAAREWSGALPMQGLYQPTPHNEPCRRVYPENGFEWREGRWHGDPGRGVAAPDWLEVKSGLASVPAAVGARPKPIETEAFLTGERHR